MPWMVSPNQSLTIYIRQFSNTGIGDPPDQADQL